MPPVHEFLQAVEARLRCPAERRPAVSEELRGHLADRTEALLAQGVSEADAERQAVREMGRVWLLALRLSAANGWSLTAHVLRELWAAWLGTLMILPAVVMLRVLTRPLLHPGATGVNVGEWAIRGLTCSVILAGLAAFSFAMGRTVRGWVWVAAPALVAARNAFPLAWYPLFGAGMVSGGPATWLAPAAVILVFALVGQRRESPSLHWLAWMSAGTIWGWASVVAVIAAGTADGGELSKASAHIFWINAVQLAAVAALPWLFWLGAWLIERAGRAPAAPAAE